MHNVCVNMRDDRIYIKRVGLLIQSNYKTRLHTQFAILTVSTSVDTVLKHTSQQQQAPRQQTVCSNPLRNCKVPTSVDSVLKHTSQQQQAPRQQTLCSNTLRNSSRPHVSRQNLPLSFIIITQSAVPSGVSQLVQ